MGEDLAVGLWIGGWLALIGGICLGAGYAGRGERERDRFLRWLGAVPVLGSAAIWVAVLPAPWNVAAGLASLTVTTRLFGWDRVPVLGRPEDRDRDRDRDGEPE